MQEQLKSFTSVACKRGVLSNLVLFLFIFVRIYSFVYKKSFYKFSLVIFEYNVVFYFTGSSPYDARLCLQDGPDTSDNPIIKSDEELSRVYQSLSLPPLSRDDANNSNR